MDVFGNVQKMAANTYAALPSAFDLGTFGPITTPFTNGTRATGIASGRDKKNILTIAMAFFFLIAVLVAAGYFISMLVKIPGVGGPSLPKTDQPLWTEGEILSQDANINLRGDISGSVSATDDSSKYTISLEIQIQGPYSNTDALRHIFHRGEPITDAANNPVAENNIQKPLHLKTAWPTIKMNPGVFLLDKSTNQLWVVIQNNGKIIASAIINDVPVFRPFRLTISVSRHVMDIYVDCKLINTVYINGEVPTRTPTTVYGHLGTDFPGIVGGVRAYRDPFIAKQVQMLCGLSPVLTLLGSDYTATRSCEAQ